MRRPEFSGFQPPIGERSALLPELGPGASGLGLPFIWLDADGGTAGCRARLAEVVGHCPITAALIMTYPLLIRKPCLMDKAIGAIER